VDGTGSGSCPVAGFGISGAEPRVSATRQLEEPHPRCGQKFPACREGQLFKWHMR
jgi:hypothetical protein